jgi:photosystem II stability/assembly factor-like uncharacterized protein
MISFLKKIFGLHLLPVIFFISLANTVNAQWVRVDTSGIPKCIAGDGEYIYVGFHGGYYHPGDTAAARNIIRSGDGGLTWENVSNGLTSESIYSLNIESLCSVGSNMLAGTRNGIFISSDQGDNWIQTNYDPLFGEVTALFAIDSFIFAGSADDNQIIIKPGLFISSDEGQSWLRSDSGLWDPLSGVYPSIYALTSIDTTIFAGTKYGVFSSNDKGKTWIWDTLGVFTTSFAVIDSTLFAGHYGSSFISRSKNLGISWTRCDSGLPSPGGIPFLAAGGNKLIAGTHFNGVYYSKDMGNHWKPVNEGFDSFSDWISTVGIIDNYVFAGTESGLWWRPLSEITSIERFSPVHPKGFELRQNYPNPFNSVTVISWKLAVDSHVNLSIYNILGQKLTTLVNKRQSAGDYQFEWNAGSLSSGVYIYTLETSRGFKQSRKLILLK